MIDDILISLEEAARQLGGVSTKSVRREAAEGKLHIIKMRGRSVASQNEVQALIEKLKNVKRKPQ